MATVNRPSTSPCADNNMNNGPDGCCTSDWCFVIKVDYDICFCDRNCHNVNRLYEDCCDDVTYNGCYRKLRLSTENEIMLYMYKSCHNANSGILTIDKTMF